MQREQPKQHDATHARAGIAALAPLWLTPLLAACAVPKPAAPPDRVELAAAPRVEAPRAQDPPAADLPVLLAGLATSGADGREVREAAIEQLLASPQPAAHEALSRALTAGDDRDDVRTAVALALQRHLQLAPAQQFGGMPAAGRAAVAKAYFAALAPLWRTDASPAPESFAAAARLALQRWPARELDAAARAALASGDAGAQVAALRCLADLQQVHYAATIAEWIESPDMGLRQAAQEALQTLTCNEELIRTRAAFAAWQQRHGGLRYVDLAERAARRSLAPLERMKAEMAQLRVDAARDVVRAHVARGAGVDWKTVQERVVVDDAATLDACLELLQQTLPGVPDDASPARQSFARALLLRFRAEPAEKSLRRARLLEVAAALARSDDAELANELVALLLAQFDVADRDVQIAALRGLRRFPAPETRARLVAMAARLLAEQPSPRDLVAAILQTLGARAAPRWPAPGAADADKADWLALVTAACRSDEALGLRQAALDVAQALDTREQRVPEVFGLLLDVVRDPQMATKFRSNCAILLQGWRADAAFAAAWLAAQHELLRDANAELRQQAAESLATLVESNDVGRTDAIGKTIVVVRSRLVAEPDPAVLRALANCLQECGRTSGTPEMAIGAIRVALTDLGSPVPAEQQFRLDPLLQALATIGADPRADRGQWLAACPPLLDHKRRQSLRLILANHGAIDLAKDVGGVDVAAADRARAAMTYVVEAAALKPAREPWGSSDELQREARDVRTAFSALDALPEKDRPDRGALRLLRLAVELAVGKPQDVAQRAATWLGSGGANGANGTATNASASGAGAPSARVELTEAEKDRMRALAAEAQLAMGKPDAARKLLDERAGDDGEDAPAVREVESKVAKALVATDLAGAVALYERVLRRTAKEDPAFRGRLLDWAQHRLRLDPALRDDTVQAVAPHAALFDAPDCPAEQRDAFAQLRAGR